MPIVLEPDRLSPEVLEQLARELKAELAETLDLLQHPSATVRDPASIETGTELVRATLAVLERPGARDKRALAADANLAYATLLASIDLLKSHSDLPRVPARRKAGSGSAAP